MKAAVKTQESENSDAFLQPGDSNRKFLKSVIRTFPDSLSPGTNEAGCCKTKTCTF